MRGDLEKAFNFDEPDISLNESGQLSKNQLTMLAEIRRIRRFGGKLAFGAFFLTTVFFTGMWLSAIELDYDHKKHFEMSLGFVAVLSIMWVLFLFSSILGIMRSDLNSQKISTVEGYAECKIKIHRKLEAYYVKIGNVKFRPGTAAQYDAIKPGGHYKVFYIKDMSASIILSITEI